MDPNLTLAHITHNTAVVLLHQFIAYSSIEWQNALITLPSASSAETCLAAATEVAIIAARFLQESPIITNPQFSFCLFICGRMLLAHASYYGLLLSSELDSLTGSLWEISRRWTGSWALLNTASPGRNLASKFAARLVEARSQSYASLDISRPAISEDSTTKPATPTPTSQRQSTLDQIMRDIPQHDMTEIGSSSVHTNSGYGFIEATDGSPESISLAFPPLPLSFHHQSVATSQTKISSPYPSSGNHSGSQVPHCAADNGIGNDDMTGFAGLGAYLEQSFPVNQRISVYSKSSHQDAAL